MYPSIKIGSLEIYLYYVMIALGVIIGLILTYFFVYKKEKMDRFTGIRLLACYSFGGALLYLGALLFDSLFHSIEEGKFVFGGITWLGGVVLAFPLTILLIHLLVPRYKGKEFYIFSLILPFIILSHSFGRIGCFLNGCCYGKVTNSFLGVKFPFLQEKVLPTQFFEAIFDIILFFAMVIFYPRIKRYNLEIYFNLYGVFRFVIEYYRGDNRGETGFFLTPGQLLSAVIVLCGVLLLLYRKGIIFKKIQASIS